MSERKELAARLRAVAESMERDSPAWDTDDIRAAADLLDPPARGRTVRVRACVAVDPKGAWNVAGWSSVQSNYEKSARDIAIEGVGEGERISWIECDVPLPEETTVEGEVTNG